MGNTLTTKKVSDLVDNDRESPLPISVIPNYMGINLCSVDSLSWVKQDDGQLVSLTINFIPAQVVKRRARCRVGVAGSVRRGRRT